MTIIRFVLGVCISMIASIYATQVDYSCLHNGNWLVNENNHFNSLFGAYTDIMTSGPTSRHDYWSVSYTGIPNYDRTFTQKDINKLNSRPKASSDFRTGQTSAVPGNFYVWGTDIGYYSTSKDPMEQDCMGFWPPGPECPANQHNTQTFTLSPAPESGSGCYTGLGPVGYALNGVSIFNWADGTSYNNENSWYDLAGIFEYYDMDVCGGHAAMGQYHQHFYPSCLADTLGDIGSGHSPLYGFAMDGYPVYGPYQAAGVLATSCWKTRDYSASTSTTGCADGKRSCKMVDPFTPSRGTSSNGVRSGPAFTQVIQSQSYNSYVANNGVYYEDYYYDASCTAQGISYLDEFNGHDHDGLGFHYHVTVNASMAAVFPYIVGPKFYGCISTSCQGPMGVDAPAASMSVCGTSTAATPQCLATTTSAAATPATTVSSSQDDSSSLSKENTIVVTVISIFGVMVLLVVMFFMYRSMRKSATEADEPLLNQSAAGINIQNI